MLAFPGLPDSSKFSESCPKSSSTQPENVAEIRRTYKGNLELSRTTGFMAFFRIHHKSCSKPGDGNATFFAVMVTRLDQIQAVLVILYCYSITKYKNNFSMCFNVIQYVANAHALEQGVHDTACALALLQYSMHLLQLKL